ncbi:hypothetical protein BJH93_06795 [Kocuria polaris]|nr:hypothetical protein [Kocuria polaris]
MTDGGQGQETVSARRRLPPAAHLRVFEPLRAYDDDAQRLIAQQRSTPRAELERLLAEAALKRIMREISDPFPSSGVEQYRVLHYPGPDGATAPYFCPDQLQTRATISAERLDDLMRPQVLAMVMPEASRTANAERTDPDRFAEDVAHLHTRTSVWGVPLAWFVALREDDHLEIDEDEHSLLSVRLAAPAVQVLERARVAAASLAINAPELDILDELTSLGDWLGSFHEDSIVELDYGLLADYVWPDESPQDLRIGIDSLGDGDMLGAAAAYRRLTNRWVRVRQHARSN